MIALKEIRLHTSAPNLGAEVYANRRTTSTFLVGAEGVVDITLADGQITVVTKKGSFGVPASACQWWLFADAVEDKVETKASRAKTAKQNVEVLVKAMDAAVAKK